jgi:low temperature requirement protein LtrA
MVKLSTDRKAIFSSGKVLTIMGIILSAVGLVGLVRSFVTGAEYTGFSSIPVMMIVGGIVLMVMSRSYKNNENRYRRYISLIVNSKQIYIDNIASLMNVPINVVMEDLQKMIRAGYFSEAYLDMTTRRIVIPERSYAQGTRTSTVICSSCGASNTLVIGQQSECEYCGSPLK